MEVLDLFSAAAGGWSLGMHRAGFQTIAACENVAWRRALYQENNPHVRIYDDVCTLTADQLFRDFGRLPSVIVGSPPCQDISSANTKGKGVEGERSGLYFEAVRIIGEVRPRWFALENSSNLRTRGADAVLAALEALGYACWSFVVRAGDIGANHERPRCWIIGCDISQVANSHHQPVRRSEQPWSKGEGGCVSGAGAVAGDIGGQDGSGPLPRGYGGMGEVQTSNPDGFGRNEGRSRGWRGLDVSVSEDTGHVSRGYFAKTTEVRHATRTGDDEGARGKADGNEPADDVSPSCTTGDASHADQAGQADGCMVAGLRQEEIANDGRGSRRGHDGSIARQMAVRPGDSFDPSTWRADWSLDDLASHLQLDDGLSAWVAGTRIEIGGPRGTSAASLIVEAFGDAVVPQIPEAIGRAIWRTESALAAIYGREAA